VGRGSVAVEALQLGRKGELEQQHRVLKPKAEWFHTHIIRFTGSVLVST
jgi:hypothetical protein